MITKEKDMIIRSVLGKISDELDKINHLIPADIEEIYEAYKKINEGIIEFAKAMKKNIEDSNG